MSQTCFFAPLMLSLAAPCAPPIAPHATHARCARSAYLLCPLSHWCSGPNSKISRELPQNRGAWPLSLPLSRVLVACDKTSLIHPFRQQTLTAPHSKSLVWMASRGRGCNLTTWGFRGVRASLPLQIFGAVSPKFDAAQGCGEPPDHPHLTHISHHRFLPHSRAFLCV